MFNKEIVSALNGAELDTANVCEQHLDPLRELADSSLFFSKRERMQPKFTASTALHSTTYLTAFNIPTDVSYFASISNKQER